MHGAVNAAPARSATRSAPSQYPTMHTKDHWERVYTTKPVDGVSWYQQHAEVSLRLIRQASLDRDASIIDVGAGASTLIDDLLVEGYRQITLLDLSAAALAASRARLGSRAGAVRWIEADLLRADLHEHAYDLWHDRAVFHFLTLEDDRRAYVRQLLRAVKPQGHVIVATFAQDGPTQCSGLPVVRYAPEGLQAQLGPAFSLLRHEHEEHPTPFGTTQHFLYCHFRRIGS